MKEKHREKMEVAKEKKEDDAKENNSNSNYNYDTMRLKRCKGYLYYSSSIRSKTCNPLCLGISSSREVDGTVKAHRDLADRWERDVVAPKMDWNPSDFKYGCLGDSIHMHLKSKDFTTSRPQAKADWPSCIGYEFLVHKKVRAPARLPERVSAPVLSKADAARVSPPLKTPKPATSSTRDGFQTRFTRNARLVASGVANNLIKVGNRVKRNLEDMSQREGMNAKTGSKTFKKFLR